MAASLTFDDWFARASGGREPHPFQRALACDGDLPDLLAVPTGCGKTAAAVLAWAWRRRVQPDGRTPRRLVYCLPMRTLVDQVYREVRTWFCNLGWIGTDAAGCERYRPRWDADDVPIFRLIGGEEATDWEARPEREAVLIGTQDMLLSRALNRGYAMRPPAWPLAYGLLNVDALWVLDEVQLMGVGRTTSAQLDRFRRSPAALPRRSLWMSATLGAPASDGTGEWVQRAPTWMRTPERGDADVRARCLAAADRRRLDGVLRASKTVAGPPYASCEEQSVAQRIVTASAAGKLVLVMMNRVSRARDVYRRIRELAPTPPLLLHSRLRPRERRRALAALTSPVPSQGRIVVSTQVLEAGVDLDADALFTEICPWPSLVQRLGRLNRRGAKRGVVELLEIPLEPPKGGWPKKGAERQAAEEEASERAALPYTRAAMDDTRSRLTQLGTSASIAALEALDAVRPSSLAVEGPVLRVHHLDDLFDTDPDLSGGHLDVSRFVRSDAMDLDVSVLWRRLDGGAPDPAPPHPDELCPVPLHELRRLGDGGARALLLGLQPARKRTGAWRAITVGDPSLRPGDTVILDVGAGGYDPDLGWTGDEAASVPLWIDVVGERRAWVREEGGQAILVEEVDERTTGWAARDEDPRSQGRVWMTLGDHLSKAADEARAIGQILVPEFADRLAEAGRWHDVGKALERSRDGADVRPFQVMLRRAGHGEGSEPRDHELYAKSNGRGSPWKPRNDRFRHEVASALAYLAKEPVDDLVAWLIMSHHGKVRLLPLPWDDDRMDDADGVRPGDRVPAEAMQLVGSIDALDLDPTRLQPARAHPGWQGRAARLLRDHGPVYLAYLEALLRVADWRASP